jgi:hypothetical protein
MRQQKSYESSELRSPRDSDAVARQWLKAREHAVQNRAILQNVRQIQWQIDHMRFRKGGSASGTRGWRWAKPKEYDHNTAYGGNQVVVVSPSNTAYTDGVLDSQEEGGPMIVGMDGWGPNGDHALPGWYVCLRMPKVAQYTGETLDGYAIHVPSWPPAAEDPDSDSNYWWLIALYPMTLNVCVSGVNVPHYVHAQPVSPLIGGEGGEAMVGEGGEGIGAEQ